jgi:hypothetical protein
MIGWLEQTWQRVRSVFRRDQTERELEAELSAHLELAIEENVNRGMSPEEARRQALIRFGGTEQTKEQHRGARGLPALEEFMHALGKAWSFESISAHRWPTMLLTRSLFLFCVAVSAS